MDRSSQAQASAVILIGVTMTPFLPFFVAGCAKPASAPVPAAAPAGGGSASSDSGSSDRPREQKPERTQADPAPSGEGVSGSLPAAGKEESGAAPTNAIGMSPAQRKQVDELYERNCAMCHGAKGDGNGLMSAFLFPKPRNFLLGHFRLVSTKNNVPTAGDLDQVLTRGMPGSSMPPWPNLNEQERQLLAERVIEFRREGIRERERKSAEEFGETVDEAEVAELVRDLTTPGEPADVAPLTARTPEAIARGRDLYLNRGCAACHANDGTGRVQQKMVDAEGFPATARDLTRGIFKGSPDEVSVYRRTQTGIPGTPMPATGQMTHEQISDLVHFVLSLSDEKTRKETVLNREAIAVRAAATLPESSADPAWEGVAGTPLRMTPLWWRDSYPTAVDIRALHDGRTIALRLEWEDVTHNDRAVRPEEFEDMVAVELFPGAPEPFLGMGSAGAPVELWHWRAANVASAESDSVLDDYPFDAPIYRQLAARGGELPDFVTARAGGNPLASAAGGSGALAARGPGSVSFLPRPSQHVTTTGEWKNGRWSVLLRRPLVVEPGTGVSLAAGGGCSLAVAVWDGAERDRGPQKVFSLWQQLRLD